MKLYFAPGACSLSPHIALLESGLPFTTEQVDLRSKKTASGADFTTINPRGYVPALQLDDGRVLTEGPAVVQYIAAQAPDKQLVPAAHSIEHYQLLERLNFISTEIHKGFGPLFNPASSADAKSMAITQLEKRFGHAADLLEGQDYLVGQHYSVADIYLFVMLTWTDKMGIDLARWPALQAFKARIAARPAVQQALADEGLTK